MGKTPDNVKKAVQKYSNKFDKVTLLLPKGTKERALALGVSSLNSYVKNLVETDMRKRRKEIMSIVTDRIRNDMKTCKTVADWSAAYEDLMTDFRDTVDGERNFEEYLSETLGVEALRKFTANIREPLYSDREVKLMEARGDFGFENDEETDEEDKIAYSRAYYSYLSHMFLAATSRCNKIEENITKVLGKEAFERLAAMGSYEKDKLWYAISGALSNGAERTKIFLDYMTDQGIFENVKKEDLEPLTLGETWTEVKDGLPEATGMYEILLQDLTVMKALFWKDKGHWIRSHMEWSPLVIAWREMKLEHGTVEDLDSSEDEAAENDSEGGDDEA